MAKELEQLRLIGAWTKLTRPEYDELAAFAGCDPTTSEWVRHALLSYARQTPISLAVMEKVLSLEMLVVNLLNLLAESNPALRNFVAKLHASASENMTAKAKKALEPR